MKKHKKILAICILTVLMVGLLSTSALAAGDVAGAVNEAWTGASGQIKTVVNSVVFPALDMILAIAFFGKLGMTYFDYRILFACLVFTLTAPTYIWNIIGI